MITSYNTVSGSTLTLKCNGKDSGDNKAVITCISDVGWYGSTDWTALECRTLTAVATTTNETETNATKRTGVFRKNEAPGSGPAVALVLGYCTVVLVMANIYIFN